VEADYLNGEICQLGRVWGVPTPVNRTLQLLANRAARDGMAAGTMDASELTAAVERANVGQPV
jgi:2-dehydropantoate 2-reductase